MQYEVNTVVERNVMRKILVTVVWTAAEEQHQHHVQFFLFINLFYASVKGEIK